MLNFIHSNPIKMYFGKGQISHLSEALDQFGKNVLLTYGGGSIKKMGLYDTVMDILSQKGCVVTELSGIEPNPRIESVEEGVRLCKEKQIDVILAVGGGSTIDASKAIAVGVYYDGPDLWEMVKSARAGVKPDKALPLIDILTISATGSEFNNGGVISNMKTNEKVGAGFTFPAVSICDPSYTFSVPKYHTAAGSADIMSHIFENYFSRTDDSELADGIAEAVLRSVMEYTPIALEEPDNYTARANLMVDSSIANCGVPAYGKQGTGWTCHALGAELSAHYDLTHGVALAIITPRWMRYILKKDPTVTDRFVRMAKNVFGLSGEDKTALAYAGIDAFEAYLKSTGVPYTLTEVGIGPELFEKFAAHANIGGKLEKAYVCLKEEDIVNIYKSCL